MRDWLRKYIKAKAEEEPSLDDKTKAIIDERKDAAEKAILKSKLRYIKTVNDDEAAAKKLRASIDKSLEEDQAKH